MEKSCKQKYHFTSDRDTQCKWLELNKDVIEIGKSSPRPLPLKTNLKESNKKSPRGSDKSNKEEPRARALTRRTNVTESTKNSSGQMNSKKPVEISMQSLAIMEQATIMVISNASIQLEMDQKSKVKQKKKSVIQVNQPITHNGNNFRKDRSSL